MGKTGPQHGIMGEDFGTDLPTTDMPEQDLSAERNAAKFSKTVEFKRLKDHFEERMDYYRNFLPDGRSTLMTDTVQLAVEWKVANAIIAELKMIIGFYEQANEAVADAARRAGE